MNRMKHIFQDPGRQFLQCWRKTGVVSGWTVGWDIRLIVHKYCHQLELGIRLIVHKYCHHLHSYTLGEKTGFKKNSVQLYIVFVNTREVPGAAFIWSI